MKRVPRKYYAPELAGCVVAAVAGMFKRGLALFSLLALVPGAPAWAGGLDEIQADGVIRVCADPHNLPFSDRDLAPAGYDLDTAAEIAKALGVRLDYVWFYTGHERKVERQLYEDNCDFIMGLPASAAKSAPRLILSQPYLRAGFVPVVKRDSAAASLADLKGDKVGVAMMTVADFYLFKNGHSREVYRSEDEMFDALLNGQLSAAMMWLPSIDWEIKRHGGAPLKLLPITDGAIEFSLAIAVRKDDTSLRDRINTVLADMERNGVMMQILSRYGLENAQAIVR